MLQEKNLPHLQMNTMHHCMKSAQIRSVFLVRIFPQLELIRIDAEYLFIFSPNAGKYEPEKTPYLDTFHAVHLKATESSNFGHAIHLGKQINVAFMQ